VGPDWVLVKYIMTATAYDWQDLKIIVALGELQDSGFKLKGFRTTSGPLMAWYFIELIRN
jgi:hypothetical protein